MTNITIPTPSNRVEPHRAKIWPPGWEVLFVFFVSLGAAFVNDKLCLLTLGGGSIALVIRHKESPASVIGIIFAIACQSPFLRRIHDLFHGFTPGSLILIATYCAFPAIGYTLLKDLRRFREPILLPMIISGFGVLFAYCVGAWKMGIMPASIQLLQYSSGPIVFAYLVLNAKRLDVKSVATWLLTIGTIEAVYGIVQWVIPPAWDVYWFKGAQMDLAGGQALPFLMRTFGTLNSVSPFAYFLFFVLSVTLLAKRFLWCSPLLLAALGTTQGRSTWGALVIAWTIGFVLAKMKDRAKLATSIGGTILLIGLCVMPFADKLADMANRLKTVTNLKGDSSFNDRSDLMTAALEGGALNDPIGVGLGGAGAAARVGGSGGLAGIDNGFLQTIWIFGWIGSLLYLGGFMTTMGRGILGIPRLNTHEILFLAATIALFAANLFESSFDDIKGVMVWMSLAIINIGATRNASLSGNA